MVLHFVVRDALLTHVEKLLSPPGETESSVKKEAIVASALLIGTLSVQILNFEAVRATFEVPASWSETFNSKCGSAKLENAFTLSAMAKYGQCTVAWGTYFGYLARRKLTHAL